jgi:hypothetical protein
MKLITLFILFIQMDAFINKYIHLNRNKNRIKLKSSFNIQPYRTIAFYKLDSIQKTLISKSINDRFIMKPIYINDNITDYLGLTLFKYNTSQIDSISYKCQLFVYVKDTMTNLYGQYILESVEYKNGLYIEKNCVLCSFYSNNSNYYSHISYYQNIYDSSFFNNYNYFDFIYENETYYKNTKNSSILNNIIRYPMTIYISKLKYKDIIWLEADQIIYYKNSFNYVKE